MFRRYAIYYTPPPSPLAAFGAAWLGWDIARGCRVQHPAPLPGLPAPIAELTQTPRRYGFHATMKPPFRLHPDAAPQRLRDSLDTFCAARPAIALAGVTLARLGRFVALVPTGDTTALDRLAAGVVRHFDSFRAPPTTAELARYGNLHDRPDLAENVRRWGYPHVMAQFRWHMTLTGKRPRAETEQTLEALTPAIAALLPCPLTIDALSLVGEDGEGRFHLIHRAALGG